MRIAFSIRSTPSTVCGTCGKRLVASESCRVFPGHHARCIEKAVARARALAS